MHGSVRAATPDDAEAIARVHLASHREVYVVPGRIPADVIEAWSERDRAAYWRQVAERTRDAGGHRLVVAEVDGAIVGFASGHPSPDDDLDGGCAVGAIYVLEAHHGTGLGQRLLDAAAGEGPATLWVLADNPRARAFYARNGFAPDGAAKTDPRWGDVPEIRLARP